MSSGNHSHMQWFKRRYGNRNRTAERARFKWLFINAGEPPGMMMVADKMVRDAVYVSLPDERWASDLPGFKPVSLGELPQEARLLIGDQEEFDKRFPAPAGP